MVDVIKHNKNAWNNEVSRGNMWTIPVTSEEVAAAKNGKAEFLLTPEIFVPKEWYMPVSGKRLLLLASGGGQQGPLFAALGAEVTVFDNSDAQLNQDRMVAERDNLIINTVQGDMKDLSVFEDESFDMVFHPVSNCFVDDVAPVWQESFRVLKKGGNMIAGIANPIIYMFDMEEYDRGNLAVKYKIPYADTPHLSEAELQKRIANNETLEYGHSLDAQLGGMVRAGFHIVDFFEDGDDGDLLDKYIKTFMAVRLWKPI